jgi:hypothetical protein
MRELLNNTKLRREEHKTSALVSHTWPQKLNIKHESNNNSLYCFFTRNKRDSIVTNNDTKQK